MGSGKGKSHRARTTMAKKQRLQQRVIYDGEVWADYVRSAGLEDITLEDYYLGDAKKKSDLFDVKTHAKVTSEFFKDAVAIGAVKLPPDMDVDDFSFLVASSQDPDQIYGAPEIYYQVYVTHKAVADAPIDPATHYYLLEGDPWEGTPMGRNKTVQTANGAVIYGGSEDFLHDLSEGVDKFIKRFGKKIRAA